MLVEDISPGVVGHSMITGVSEAQSPEIKYFSLLLESRVDGGQLLGSCPLPPFRLEMIERTEKSNPLKTPPSAHESLATTEKVSGHNTD